MFVDPILRASYNASVYSHLHTTYPTEIEYSSHCCSNLIYGWSFDSRELSADTVSILVINAPEAVDPIPSVYPTLATSTPPTLLKSSTQVTHHQWCKCQGFGGLYPSRPRWHPCSSKMALSARALCCQPRVEWKNGLDSWSSSNTRAFMVALLKSVVSPHWK